MAVGTNTDKAAKVLVGSIVAALVIQIFGDSFESMFSSDVNNIVDVAPVVVVALGLYGAFTAM
jgi:uncharacterized membrane protein (DUF373 family)